MSPSLSGSGALLALAGALALRPAGAQEADDAARIVKAAYAGYDPATEALPAEWRNPPVAWLDTGSTAASHVVIRVEETEESRVGGKLSAPARKRVETWRWDGRQYVKVGP